MKHPSLSRLLAVFWALCLLCLGAAQALEVPRLEAPVNDQARLLSEGTRDRLNNYLQQAQQKYGVRIAALIVPSLEGESMDSLATKTAAAWGFGKQGEDKGVLLLVAVKEELVHIETGRGVEGKLTEALGARIINEEMRPFFKEGAASRGVAYGMLALVPASVVGKFTPSEKALESAARVRAAAASAGQGAAPPVSAAKPETPASEATKAADASDVEAGTNSGDVGSKGVAGVLLLLLSAALGLFVRRHNWGRVCLAALVLGAAGTVLVGNSLVTTQESAVMAAVGGVLMGVPVFAFVALSSLVIRIAWRRVRRHAAPVPIEEEQEAAAPAVERPVFSSPAMERTDFSAPSMERTDFSAPGGQKQSTWKETPQEAKARREAIAKASRARRQAALASQPQQSLFKEVFDALFGDFMASKEVSWGTIAAAICGLVLAPLFVYFALGDEMEFRRATEREEVTAHLLEVSVSCSGSGSKEECTHTPIYGYSFHGEDYTYGGASDETNSRYAKPYFPEEIQLIYYKNSKGKWVRTTEGGILAYLTFYGGALFMFVLALGALVIELKKLLGRTQG